MHLRGGVIYWFKKDFILTVEQCPIDQLATTEELKIYFQQQFKVSRQNHTPMVEGNDLLHLQDAIFRWNEEIESYEPLTLDSIKSFKAAVFNETVSIPIGEIIAENTEVTYSESIAQFRANKPYPIIGEFIAANKQIMSVVSINGIVGIGIPQYQGMEIKDIMFGYYKENPSHY